MNPGFNYVLALGLMAFTGCATIDEKTEIEPGERPSIETTEGGIWMAVEKAEQDIKVDGRRVKDKKLNDYIKKITCNLAGPYCPDIRVYILDVNHFNASMYPNGAMVVWTGLLLRVQNESQLAAVLGHEISHYVKKHTLKRFLDIQAKQDSLVLLNAILPGAALLAIPMMGQIAAYSRDHEREADSEGLNLLVKNNYSAGGAAEIWEYISTEQEAGEDGKESFSFLSSHPLPDERMANLREQAKSSSQPTQPKVGEDEFLNAIAHLRGGWLKEELRRGEYKQTEILLNHIPQSPLYPGEHYFFKGELIRLQREKDHVWRAIEQYQKAIERDPNDPRPRKGIGLMLLKTDQKDRAVENLNTYLRLKPYAEDFEIIKSMIKGAK